MQFFENLKEFFSLAQNNNFDMAIVYEQAPNSVYSVILIVLLLLLIVFFFIRRSFKISGTLKLVSQVKNSKEVNEYTLKLSKLANELPKRGLKVAQSVNASKKEILEKELVLLSKLDIKEKIEKYQEMSKQYILIANNSKKYKIEELNSFYEENSKKLLDVNLLEEILKYSKETSYNTNDIEIINLIEEYTNTRDDKELILSSLIKEINSFSYTHNLDLYKFVKALDKSKCPRIYDNCVKKLNEMITSKENRISNVIVSYILENENKEEIYNYISNLENAIVLQDIYFEYFAKSEDINLDLAFVSNKTKILSSYSEHIDNQLTSNWKDISYIKHIIESPGVLESIGHISYRNVLERIERLEKEEETNKAISNALEIARRAESIAKEAKSIARQK